MTTQTEQLEASFRALGLSESAARVAALGRDGPTATPATPAAASPQAREIAEIRAALAASNRRLAEAVEAFQAGRQRTPAVATPRRSGALQELREAATTLSDEDKRAAILAALIAKFPTSSVAVTSVYDTEVIYQVFGDTGAGLSIDSTTGGHYRIAYTITDTGVVTLDGAPVKVTPTTTYVAAEERLRLAFVGLGLSEAGALAAVRGRG